MKRYLYLDNYRGFSNSSVPLADVNFFVGQNSSGKTSILTLLKLFSNHRLFLGPEYGTDDLQIGHFNELVSAHSKDRSYFRIGSCEEGSVTPKGAPGVSGMLFTYKENAGMPQMSHVTCVVGDKEVTIRFEDDGRIVYKKVDAPRSITAEDLNKRIPKWVQYHIGNGNGWREITLPKVFEGKGREVPLAFLLSFAVREKGSKGSGFDFFMPSLGPQLVWIAPIRTTPQRTYDKPGAVFSSDGSHTPYVIRRMLSSKQEAIKFGKFMRRIGKESGLFEKIETKCFGAKNDPTAPFEVDAVLDGKALPLNWVGYGVSQSLPIFVELLDRPAGSCFAIQQPEVHLHPRAQASLGDVFFDMAIRDGKSFHIETHSDFTIDRFRMNYRRKKKVPESQILFFERRDKHNVVTSLPISSDGNLPSQQPEGYRKFFIKEELRILGI